MAAQNQVQELVRAIIGAVNNLDVPQPQSQPPQSSDQPRSSVEEELNRSFPTLAGTASRSARGRGFNPRVNYTLRPQRARPPRNENAASSRKDKADEGFFMKDLCLLPSPTWDTVPRGATRADLIEKDLFVDAFQMKKSWGEEELYRKIETQFKHHLAIQSWDQPLSSAQHLIQFEFVKSSGSRIVPLTLVTGQEKTARVIKHVSGQGPIYVRSLESLEKDDNEDGDLDNTMERYTSLPSSPPPSSPPPSSPPPSSPPPSSSSTHTEPHTDQPSTSSSLRDLDFVVAAGFTEEAARRASLACGPDASTSEIIDWLCTGSSQVPMKTADESLQEAQASLMDPSADHTLLVRRDQLWRSALGFYKQCLGTAGPGSKLRRNLQVIFEGEEGVDAGAITLEFFASLLGELDKRLFEGQENRRVPRRSWAVNNHIIAGMIIGHSLLLNGPAYAALSPCVFQYLATGTVEGVMLAEDLSVLPTRDDIPHDASTDVLLQVIEKMNMAATQDEVDAILDVPEYMEVINQSGWLCTDAVTMTTKNNLVQGLLMEEVVTKRTTQLNEMRRGLQIVGILHRIEANPSMWKKFFVHDPNGKLSSDAVKDLFKDTRPTQYPQYQAYDWFMAYVDKAEETCEEFPQGRLKPLLQFMTGLGCIPPLGFKSNLKIEYLQDDDTFEFPHAQACFCTIMLPVVHTTQDVFFHKMDKALSLAATGFGRM